MFEGKRSGFPPEKLSDSKARERLFKAFNSPLVSVSPMGLYRTKVSQDSALKRIIYSQRFRLSTVLVCTIRGADNISLYFEAGSIFRFIQGNVDSYIW